MFTATEFTYDGVYSGIYGLKIASFNTDAMEETSYVVPTINTVKSAKSPKFYYLDATLDSPPTYEFSVVSESAIQETILRDILKWFDAKKGFRELTIMQPAFDNITYRCVFTVTSLIYHSGCCVGMNLLATFDSPYQYAAPVIKTLKGDGTEKTLNIFNASDNVGEYIYPKVEFTVNDAKGITIVNASDDPTRAFTFYDKENAEGGKESVLNPNVTYVVDNEMRIITGEGAGIGSDLLAQFSKKWLRLREGRNTLTITVNGQVTITCPQYVKISF